MRERSPPRPQTTPTLIFPPSTTTSSTIPRPLSVPAHAQFPLFGSLQILEKCAAARGCNSACHAMPCQTATRHAMPCLALRALPASQPCECPQRCSRSRIPMPHAMHYDPDSSPPGSQTPPARSLAGEIRENHGLFPFCQRHFCPAQRLLVTLSSSTPGSNPATHRRCLTLRHAHPHPRTNKPQSPSGRGLSITDALRAVLHAH